MSTAVARPRDRPLLNLGLLGMTAVSTFCSFYFVFSRGLPNGVQQALTFSGCLLLVLGTHEMGHYVFARLRGVDASLPYFIPFPFGVGTLGAVIRIRDRIPNRNALVDIGAAGPLAGLAVALPMLVYGLMHSHLGDAVTVPTGWPTDTSLRSAAEHGMRYFLARSHGQVLPVAPLPQTATWFFGDSVLTLLLKRIVLGTLPAGRDVYEHPAYIAAWFGLLVTMLNLLPIGQLDGGHLTHALFGRRAQLIGKVAAAGMVCLCIFASAGWLLWLGVTAGVIGFRHPEVVRPEEPLSRARRWVCFACAVGLALCVIPVPLTVVGR
jgi:membrane-associated protease RseP (regulator of RpoE activity)